MDHYQIHADGVKSVMDEQGEACPVFIWQGKPYRIQPGSAVRGKDLGAGGFRLRSDLKFATLVSELPDPAPALKQTIVYLGDEYRIDTMEKFAGDLMVRFECNDPDPA